MKQPAPKVPATSHSNEVDYLAQHQGGDRQAFRQLVDQYRDRIVQFFFRLCWDRDRAEDLAQELFLKLLIGSKRYRPEGKMTTFVYRVATNLWIDHYRQMRPRPRFHSLDQVTYRDGETGRMDCAGDEREPSERLQDGEERAAMRRALESLTEPHRLVFELAVYQERPYAEISELLGIPVGTVKSRMHNAVSALKQMLGDGESDRQVGGA
ncbi:MAG: RNA polymerase sigma factor [bacterium]|nr:RNA polymerase sigma factor [bacterium]